MSKALAAIVGPGNIGTDLLAKLRRSDDIEVGYMVGVDRVRRSGPCPHARRPGARPAGVDWLLAQDRRCRDSSSRRRPPRRTWRTPRGTPRPASVAVDLTPAAVGPLVCPPVNLARPPRRAERQHDHLRRPGDDPDRARRVAASSRSPYAEIVASVASRSAGPGTRANIDEFTETTTPRRRERRRRDAGQGDHHPQPGRAADDHARHGVLRDPGRTPTATRSPASIQRDGRRGAGVRARLHAARRAAVRRPARALAAATAGSRSSSRSAGPATTCREYAGNLDIMTAAAVRVGELVVREQVSVSA